jgi:hypothetical protein
MTRGGKKHQPKNKNRIPMGATPRDNKCCICLDEFIENKNVISCSNHHGVCSICIKQLLMPCNASWKGQCSCCGISWKCPICRVHAGFPNAWVVMQFMLTEEEQTKAIDRANSD